MNISRLIELIDGKKYTKAALAAKCGFSRVTIDNLLSGADVKISTIEGVAGAYDVPVGYFFDDDTKTDSPNAEPLQGSEMVAMPREVLDLLLSQQKTIDSQVQIMNSQQGNFAKLTDAVVAQQQTIAELTKRGGDVGNARVAVG